MGRLTHSPHYACAFISVISFWAAIMSTFPENHTLSPPSHSLKKTENKANLEQMFLLIEGILPFEACLYYQVLPLSIEGSSLNLGMVNPDDTTAADYVRRLVSYINCSIVSRPISSDWHREILSKFLSHSAKNRQADQLSKPKTNATPSPFEEQPTLVVGAPTEIVENPRAVIAQTTADPQAQQPVTTSPSPSLPPIAEEKSLSPPSAEPAQPNKRAPLSIDLVDENGAELDAVADESSSASTPETSFNPSHSNPKELTQILLKRIITQEGIGRLYLERQSDTCRILWSKDGVVQSVVNNISIQLFQGVINELKRMMSLSLIPVRKPKQIEIERVYNQKRILLRFRVMPGENGEEATLQILRGAALKFYQQQQMDNLGRDALGLAHDLQQRIDDLRTQAQRNLDAQGCGTQQKTLPAIMTMLKQMEQQLHDIIETSN
ncbi:MAG: hypothetical protein AAGF93_20080 [Cyanobacteria bacterium P01_H01_bin.105]